MTPFRVVAADPPWQYKDKLPGTRGAESHYPTMKWEDIALLELPPIADDALLFLWRVKDLQHEALAVMHMWGFTLKSELIWVKNKTGLLFEDEDPTENELAFGMGRITRQAHEVCLIGARGKYSKLIKKRNVRSVFYAPREEHSKKPDKFYNIVERITDGEGPYVDIFARRQRAGWIAIGNELGTTLNRIDHSQEDHSGSTGSSSAAASDDGPTRGLGGDAQNQAGGTRGAA